MSENIQGVIAPTEHAPFAPSKLEQFEGCPASFRMCSGWTQEDTGASLRGSQLHQAFWDDNVLSSLSDEDRQTILDLRREHLDPYTEEKGFKVFHELHVDIMGDDDDAPLTWGTLDCLVISPDGTQADLIDLKFGRREVTPAEHNPQIQAYVAGVFHKFPTVQTVFAMIEQPAFGIGDYTRQFEFKREVHLPKILERVKSIIKRASEAETSDDSCYVCNADNCRYCNKYACRIYRKAMESNMQLVGASGADALDALGTDTRMMTLDYADKVKRAAKMIEERIETATAQADAVILAAGGSQNFRVVDGRTTKRTDWKRFCKDNNITDNDISPYTTETVGKPYVMPRLRKGKG